MDLKIADYLVEKQPDESMGWQDVVHIAMQRELASMNLYKNLASKVTDPCAKSLLENLAADEAEHKLFFERIWDEDILAEN
jgi:rubrerythrin